MAIPPQASTEQETALPAERIPTMAEIFGPGGLLEKCMPAGYEHRRSQLEMAELVDEAFRTKQHLLVEAGTGHRQNARLSDSRDSQRAARGHLHGHEIAPGTAFAKGRALRAEAFRAGFESSGDEGPREFLVPGQSCTRWKASRCSRGWRSSTGSRKFATGSG